MTKFYMGVGSIMCIERNILWFLKDLIYLFIYQTSNIGSTELNETKFRLSCAYNLVGGTALN